ncbi:MAG: hypothetical protein IKO46_07120 [Salinivirgaceae bacterium]|nr:hypothetical protein [Salinivirgaceae bacterium]
MELLTLAIPMLLYAAAFGALRFAKRVAFAGHGFVSNNYLFVNQQNTPPPIFCCIRLNRNGFHQINCNHKVTLP